MEEYTLTYFNTRGIAEAIRFIFAVAGVDFEDVRIEKADWANMKSSMKWGQLPVLTYDSRQLAQSATIGRFLAKKFSLAGNSDWESALADEIVDAVKDVTSQFGRVYREENSEKKEEAIKSVIDDLVTPCLTKLNELKEDNGGDWIVGQNVTWADLYVVTAIDFWAAATGRDVLENFPNLKAYQQRVFDLPQIKAWIEKRPETAL